ncbi:MAG TPA: tetratricopeptide repeat protein [Pyrinomonadaceae bacterium]
MTRENLLFSIIGLLLGFIVGFMFASSMNQKYGPGTQATASTQALPSDHPPVGTNAAANPGVMQAEVTASLEKARNEPKNFEAQVKAAELYYQIQQFDQSIEYLLKANQIKPDDYQTVVTLGMVNLDAGHFDTAERWYKAAMKMKSDDSMVLAGLAETMLQKGDPKAAEEAIARFEKVEPNSQDLQRFKSKLASLRAGK